MASRKFRVLMVVDVQNSFCPGGELAVPAGDDIIPYINLRLQSGEYDRRIASKESHPADHKSFASQHKDTRPYIDSVSYEGITQLLWPDHCVTGSHGEKFHSALRTDLLDKIVVKGTDPVFHSFSSFWLIPERKPTELLEYILSEAKAAGFTRSDIEVDVVGLALDYCVRDTAIDAAKSGLNTRLLLAGTRAVNVSLGDDLRAIELMEKAGVSVVPGRLMPRLVVSDFERPARELKPAIQLTA